MLLNLDDTFAFEPKEIHIWYTETQAAYKEIIERCKIPVFLHEEIPTVNELPPEDSIVVWDDFQANTSATQIINKFFLKICRHNKLTGICILQNLFDVKDRFVRSINLNSNVLVIFRNIRDSLQIANLSRQVYPNKKHILSKVLDEICKDRARGYLAVYLDPEILPSLRLRDSVFASDEKFTTIYVPR